MIAYSFFQALRPKKAGKILVGRLHASDFCGLTSPESSVLCCVASPQCRPKSAVGELASKDTSIFPLFCGRPAKARLSVPISRAPPRYKSLQRCSSRHAWRQPVACNRERAQKPVSHTNNRYKMSGTQELQKVLDLFEQRIAAVESKVGVAGRRRRPPQAVKTPPKSPRSTPTVQRA